jgi:hypothetical protein
MTNRELGVVGVFAGLAQRAQLRSFGRIRTLNEDHAMRIKVKSCDEELSDAS